tara:strand:+ start:2424 stop:2615 length:192 start_codon:yes stop_codon:yes gene_type:complete
MIKATIGKYHMGTQKLQRQSTNQITVVILRKYSAEKSLSVPRFQMNMGGLFHKRHLRRTPHIH